MVFQPVVIVRELRNEDLPAVAALAKKYFPLSGVGEAEIGRRIESGIVYLVAEVEGGIAGFADFKMRARTAFLNGIAVAPEYEGKGIGTLLLQKVLESAKREGKAGVELVVKESNVNAVRFYTKNGFSIKREKRGKEGLVLVLWRGIEN